MIYITLPPEVRSLEPDGPPGPPDEAPPGPPDFSEDGDEDGDNEDAEADAAEREIRYILSGDADTPEAVARHHDAVLGFVP